MDKDLLDEIYSDISALNKVIQDEIIYEQKNSIVNINLNSDDTVTDFFNEFSHNTVNNKIIHLEHRKTLYRQLECTQLQKTTVRKILK